MTNKLATKRFLIAIGLGGLFGLLCVSLAAYHQPEIANLFNPLFWTIFSDRVLIGIMVAGAGVFTVDPLLGWHYLPCLRGSWIGILVSVPLAAGSMTSPPPSNMSHWMIFGITLLAGAIYGAIIDVTTTRIAGQGKILIEDSSCRL
ncbi:conserved membrane hypothetical protein [Gammaproteobacteria bacterium]